jgi:hypothetical protein
MCLNVSEVGSSGVFLAEIDFTVLSSLDHAASATASSFRGSVRHAASMDIANYNTMSSSRGSSSSTTRVSTESSSTRSPPSTVGGPVCDASGALLFTTSSGDILAIDLFDSGALLWRSKSSIYISPAPAFSKALALDLRGSAYAIADGNLLLYGDSCPISPAVLGNYTIVVLGLLVLTALILHSCWVRCKERRCKVCLLCSKSYAF